MIFKVREKYNQLSLTTKAAIWYVFTNVINRGITFISTPIFTRIMSTEEYGEVMLYNSWYSILLIFTSLNLFYGVFNNGMTKYPEKRKEFTSSMLGLCTTITIILFIVFLLTSEFWCKLFNLSYLLMVIMFMQLLFYPAFEFWCASKRYEYDYKNLVIISILMSIVSTIIGILAVKISNYKVIAKILSLAITNIIIGSSMFFIILKNGKKFYSKFYWKYALSFNLPLIPHYLSATVLSQADRIMIGNMVGKDYAAIYSLAYSVAMILNIVTSAIINAITPFTYESIKNKNYKSIEHKANILSIIIAVLCIVITLFAPEIIAIMGSSEYQQAIYIIPPVSASIFFMFLYPLYSNIEFYYEKTKFIMVASCISAVLNILLNYVFIKIFGFIAAGYTTLICYIVYALAHYLFSKRILNNNQIDRVYNNKFIFLISLFVILGCILCIAVYNNIIIRYAIIFIVIIGIIVKQNEIKKIFKSIKN